MACHGFPWGFILESKNGGQLWAALEHLQRVKGGYMYLCAQSLPNRSGQFAVRAHGKFEKWPRGGSVPEPMSKVPL